MSKANCIWHLTYITDLGASTCIYLKRKSALIDFEACKHTPGVIKAEVVEIKTIQIAAWEIKP